MSKYTTEVRFICETAAELEESKGGDNVKAICLAAYPEIFDSELEVFDENYKEVLFPKILMHYYTREIAFETVGLWILKLNTKMQEILPYYNQLYRSELLEFDPLHNFDLSRSHVEQGEAKSNGTGSNTGNSIYAFSDTPNGALTGVIAGNYLSAASKTDNTSATTTGTTGNDSRFWQEIIKGNSGQNFSKLLSDFRKTMLNIDMRVIDDLGDLFFKLW